MTSRSLMAMLVVGRFGLRRVPPSPSPVSRHVIRGVPVQRVPDGGHAETDQPERTVRSTARRVRLRASPCECQKLGHATEAISSHRPKGRSRWLGSAAGRRCGRSDRCGRCPVTATSIHLGCERPRLERDLERRSLEPNWSRHRPHDAQNGPQRASTTPVDRRCCVARGRAGLTPPAPGSDCECEFGEDRLEPAAGLGVVSEFVVVAA